MKNLGLCFIFSQSYRQLVKLVGRGIAPPQGRYLHRKHRHRIKANNLFPEHVFFNSYVIEIIKQKQVLLFGALFIRDHQKLTSTNCRSKGSNRTNAPKLLCYECISKLFRKLKKGCLGLEVTRDLMK
jgi:hypothetical protein